MTDSQQRKDDRLLNRKVVVAHPHRHHLYHTAQAYAEAGRLQHFLTRTWVEAPTRLAPLRLIDFKGISKNATKLSAYHHPPIADHVLIHARSSAQALIWKALGAKNVSAAPRAWGDFAAETAARLGCALHMPCVHALKAFERCKQLGVITILDQYICDRRTTTRLVEQDMERFGINPEDFPKERDTQETIETNEREYELADTFLVGCDYARQSLIDVGISPDKTLAVEYGADIATFKPEFTSRPENQPLEIAFVGSTIIRKGLLRLLEAAQPLGPKRVRIHTFGNLRLPQQYKDKHRDILKHHGHIPRAQLNAIMGQCHAFALPSLGEGGGMAACEAQAAGLPGITSTNMSSIVKDGVSGFVVPAQQTEPIREAIEKLFDEPARQEMAQQAVKAANAQTWDTYRQGVRNALGLP